MDIFTGKVVKTLFLLDKYPRCEYDSEISCTYNARRLQNTASVSKLIGKKKDMACPPNRPMRISVPTCFNAR